MARRGAAGVAAVLMFIVVGAMAMGLVAVVSRQSALAPARADTMQAFYAAEAARSLAMREITLGIDEDGDGAVGTISDDDDDATDPVIGGARAVVTKQTSGTAEILRATGYAAAATRSIEATLSNSGIGGFIRREVWTSLSGSGGAISRLTDHAQYPDDPDEISPITLLESPSNVADHYGVRVVGFLLPPATGDYTFWIASAQQSELWLSTDDSESNAVLIARATIATDPREWDDHALQESASISLVAGQRYFVYALHVADTGDDHLAVAWSGPGISQQVISGAYLSPP